MKTLNVMTMTALLSAPLASEANAQDLGSLLGGLSGIAGSLGGITSMLSSGGLMSMISMIPGLNFLAGVGPIMDIIGQIPGLSDLMGKIPGLSQILGLLGMQSSNLGPLNKQINNVGKWITSAQQLYGLVKNLTSANNFTDFASSANSIMQMAGINKTVQPSAFKNNPQAAAQEVINSLTDQQRAVLSKLNRISNPAEYTAAKAHADSLQILKGNAQRSADNATALQGTQELVKQSSDRAQDSLNYTQETAQALKDTKKTEDLLKLVGSAELENLRVAALNSAALTSALANQTKIQVAQAETLSQMLASMERDRMDKANAIQASLQAQRDANKRAADQAAKYGTNLVNGMNSAITGASLKGVDLMGGSGQ